MTTPPPDLADLASRVSAVAKSPADLHWESIERATRELVQPAIVTHGAEAVISVLTAAKDDPYVAAVLIDVSGDRDLPGAKAYHATDFFSEREIVDGVLSYLGAMPDAQLEDGAWAWTALCNFWDQLDTDSQMRVLKEVIECVPWDDQSLWMIGDMPLAHLSADPELLEIIESWPEKDKLTRTRRLVEVDWPHGQIES
jgi:hypothetical protein